MTALRRIAASLALAGLASAAHAQGFKFDQEDEAAKAREQEKRQLIEDRLSTPCKAALRNKKIVLMIGEQSSGRILANQQNYSPHFDAINRRLRALGLRTTTPGQIKAEIAQAEIDAYFKGDPDGALAASRKHGAAFVLKGLIASHAGVNRVINVNEVTVDMSFSLSEASGRPVGDASAEGGSYAGADVRSVAAKLINEQADEVVAKLYSDYCANAAPGGAKRK